MDESIARKLAVPKKLSAWEREKQAAEAKKQRQEAENAAALKEFQESLGVEDNDGFTSSLRRDAGPPAGPRSGGRSLAPRNRHGAPGNPGPRSSPGGLGPVDGHQAPPNLKRKRALDEARESHGRRDDFVPRDRSYDESRDQQARIREPDHYELPKPVVYLQSLPPSSTVEEIKALLTPQVEVYTIRLVERQHDKSGRKLLNAVATLTSNSNLTQIENTIRVLKDKYLRCGYRLSMSRFDETAFDGKSSASRKAYGPFDASIIDIPRDNFSLRNAPPPSEQRGYGPRDSYDRRGGGLRRDGLEVKVNMPIDIGTIQAIHTVVDRLLSEPDIDRALEIEALLMKLPEVQTDERFTFLYDSTSQAGVYYRYCLWSRDVVDEQKREAHAPERIFDDHNTNWTVTSQTAAFPNLTHLSQVVTDIDYASSEDESDNEDVRQRHIEGPASDDPLAETERNFLLPLQHARLTHLLARLPTVNTLLRKGDIARVTNFAINHAGRGAEQVVDKLLLNVEMPFATTAAAKYEEPERVDAGSDEEDYDPAEPPRLPGDANNETEPQTDEAARQDDPSSARLVALYVISDILSASATAGAKNSWKYRQLFQAGFKRHETFDKLGSIDRELGWGRIKMDQWRRKVGVILDIWEGWSVFSSDAMQEFRRVFNKEPEPDQTVVNDSTTHDADATKENKPKWMMRARASDIKELKAVPPASIRMAQRNAGDGGLGGKDHGSGSLTNDVAMPEASVDTRRPDVEHTELNTKAASTEDATASTTAAADGSPEMTPTSTAVQHLPATDNAAKKDSVRISLGTEQIPPASAGPPKRRMRAEDMFADSDEDGA